MFSTIWHAVIFDPIYNLLIALINIIPGGDVGLAIIILVIIIKFILFPLSIKATRTTLKMNLVQGKLKEIQEKYKNDKQALGVKTLELYRKYDLNPFSSIVLLFVQIPVVFALYFVIRDLPVINDAILYSVNHNPSDIIKMTLFGFFDISQEASQATFIILGLLAAGTQYLQTSFMMQQQNKNKEKEVKTKTSEPDFQTEFAKGMQMQMKYFMPIMTFVISFQLGASIALYWTISNLFALAQEYYIRKKVRGTYHHHDKTGDSSNPTELIKDAEIVK